MRKILFILIAVFALSIDSFAYQLTSTKENGKGDAKNQTIVVQCTTDTGKESRETCQLRRYIKCTGKDKKNCTTWQPWRNMRDTAKTYSDWKSAASDCCQKKGLR